jgi:hypothetical protein
VVVFEREWKPGGDFGADAVQLRGETANAPGLRRNAVEVTYHGFHGGGW